MARMRGYVAVAATVVSVAMLRQFDGDDASIILGGGTLRQMSSPED